MKNRLTKNDVKNLRIGNLIYRNYNVLIETQISHLARLENGSNVFKAIHLTEKLLLSFKGVEKNESKGDGWYRDFNSNLEFRIEDNYWDSPSLDVVQFNTYITCVEYVHELQNIVKEITKEDLKFRP